MTSAHTRAEPLSSVDAAWFHMDTPSNLAVITGVMTFTEPLDYNRLVNTIEKRMLIYSRFLQRVREPDSPLGRPRWEYDPGFDVYKHVLRVRLPKPGDHLTLQRMVGELMGIPLDLSRPLWQMYFVEKFDGGSALIGRLHHCIADGIALMEVLLSLADETPLPPPEQVQEESVVELNRLARLLVPVIKATQMAERTCQSAGEIAHTGIETLIHPTRLLDYARQGASASKALSKLLLIPPDRKTILKGQCGVSKQVAWTTAIEVDEVKAIGRRMGGTINDVLLSAMAGALRRYMEINSEAVDGVNIRAIVPVNLRSSEEAGQLGNRFGLVFLSLPVGVGDPLKRMLTLKHRMDAIKDSPEAVVAINILAAIGMTPTQIEHIIVSIFGMKGTAVMTNVPGPRKPLYLAGTRLNSLMFWVPQPGNLSLGVSILSYAGKVILGVAADAGLVSDPQAIIDAFLEEFEQLKHWGLPARQADDVQCQALTKSGQRCKNRALPASPTCRIHSVQIVEN